ncbi:MAG: ATP-binding cassette domain-containing protein [Erysipelothrix sp.]|nr:ATP-binding cassette domain-containing protein [Erysipelothrix sp.]
MISVKKLFKVYDDSKEILKDINLSIDKQEIFGLVGDTGSGKSTLLRLMNGFIKPSSGQVYLFGQALNKTNNTELIKKTAMIFQNFNLLENLNVMDNVCLPNKLRKVNKNETLKRAEELLVYVGLKNHMYANVNTLSGGEKQRVAIARALISNPEIIFCDEPTSALDNTMRLEILNLLKDINKSFKTTIVLVSHDIDVIKSVCDRVAILENGYVSDILTLEKNILKARGYKEALLYDV